MFVKERKKPGQVKKNRDPEAQPGRNLDKLKAWEDNEIEKNNKIKKEFEKKNENNNENEDEETSSSCDGDKNEQSNDFNENRNKYKATSNKCH